MNNTKMTWMIVALGWICTAGHAQPLPLEAAYFSTSSQVATDAAMIKVGTAFLTGVQQHNHEALKALLHAQVTWLQPGNNQLSGLKRSAAEVFAMGKIMSQRSEGSLTLESFRMIGINGNTIAFSLHWVATQPEGGVLDVTNVDLYTIDKGLITDVKVFSDNIEQENLFWGQ